MRGFKRLSQIGLCLVCVVGGVVGCPPEFILFAFFHEKGCAKKEMQQDQQKRP